MRILVATDGSEYSKAAVEKCCELIVDPKETIVKVVSAYEHAYPIAAEPFAVSGEFYQYIIDTAQKQSKLFTEDAAELIRRRVKNDDLTVLCEVLSGSPEQQIVEEANSWNADLIVVGSHGRGFWGRLLGSVSDAVVHHARCSELVVRDGGDSPKALRA